MIFTICFTTAHLELDQLHDNLTEDQIQELLFIFLQV